MEEGGTILSLFLLEGKIMMLEGLTRMLYWLRAKGDVLYPGSRATYSRIAEKEEKGSLVDIGCCFGAGTAFLASRGFKTMGIDVDFGALQLARGLYPWLEWYLYDVSREVTYEDRFDLVIALESLEHMEDQEAAMRSMLALAQKKVIITTPNGGLGQSGSRMHTHELSIEEMIALVAQNPPWKITKILVVGTFQLATSDTKCSDIYYEIEREKNET